MLSIENAIEQLGQHHFVPNPILAILNNDFSDVIFVTAPAGRCMLEERHIPVFVASV